MTAPRSHTGSEDTSRKIDLKLTHVAATALAAVTAAVLASELGAAGTVIGAAAASVITTVGTAVYKASLERSRERVRSLAHRTRPLPVSLERSRIERVRPTAVNAPLGDEQRTDGAREPQVRDHSRRFATLRWGAMVVGALGAFVLAMMVITGFEWASGGTVGGNGNGTTIGRVVTDQPGSRKPATPPVSNSPAAPTSEAPTDTTEAPETTSTTAPDDDADVDETPGTTSDRPAPSEVRQTPPLIPGLPGVGG
jgi:hypothetical protein